MKHDHSGGMGKHMLIMLICCLVPLALIAAVGTFGLSLGPLQGLVPYAAALMCPLMMIVMMRAMMTGHDDHAHTHHHVDTPHSQPANQLSKSTPGAASTTAAPGQEKCH